VDTNYTEILLDVENSRSDLEHLYWHERTGQLLIASVLYIRRTLYIFIADLTIRFDPRVRVRPDLQDEVCHIVWERELHARSSDLIRIVLESVLY
jgi:hypothetical protein